MMPTIGSKKTNNVAFDTSAPVEQVTPGGRVLYSAGEGETVVKKKGKGNKMTEEIQRIKRRKY